jgi:hypothetical protein
VTARTWSAATVLAAGLLLLSPAAAHAAPSGTPAGTGGGCRENGQAIAGSAQALQPFGAVVRQETPIAPLNAMFFATLCG